MKKNYIFLTANIHEIGGIQTYVAGKTEWLKEEGWTVAIFYIGIPGSMCEISTLNEFDRGGIYELAYPPYFWSSKRVDKVLAKMISLLPADSIENCILESNDDTTSQWGELLSQRIGAKHFAFLCSEKFRGPNKYYESKLDFYYFKYLRGELAGIDESSMDRLFDGYEKKKEIEPVRLIAASMKTVQDIECKSIEKLSPTKKYNIAYIGRFNKGYVPYILNGICEFANKYCSDPIRFTIVGSVKGYEKRINALFRNAPNVEIVALGNLVPIPQKIFSYIDVVIAGSGCAMASAREGVPTIVADAENFKANGVLGYDVDDSLYSENTVFQMDYCQALEKVLVEKEYTNKSFHLKKPANPTLRYLEHMDFIRNSSPCLEFFSREQLCEGKKEKYRTFKLYISYRCPLLVRVKEKMSNTIKGALLKK